MEDSLVFIGTQRRGVRHIKLICCNFKPWFYCGTCWNNRGWLGA